MFTFRSETKKINNIINYSAKSVMSNIQVIEKEIQKFKYSQKRKDMIVGQKYYFGEHDILFRKRLVIGEGGKLHEIYNIPNNKIVDNQYAKLADQKNNYLLSKPITFSCENKKYIEKLNKVLDKKFMKILKNIGQDSINCGIAWLYIYYDENGNIKFKKFNPYEILPFWKDEEHTELDFIVRIYEVDVYEGETEKTIEKAEIYTKNGIQRFVIEAEKLVEDIESIYSSYITDSFGNKLNWNKIPIIAFKQNNDEIPLIKRVKTLQDALNTIRSDFMNNMQEDARNTILVIKNYDGTNLAEFRKNLSEYGAVKVKSIDGADGGIDTLKIDINSSNYQVIIDMLKKAIIENGRGFDAKDERMTNNPNQMNIKSMYSDIDLDASSMESEFQTSIEELLWFVKNHIQNTYGNNFNDEYIDVIFNRDILINESEGISNCKNSLGIISDESIIEKHPWVVNAEREMRRLRKEKNAEKEVD